MQVGIDARTLTGNRSGVGNYLLNLLQAGAFDGHHVIAFYDGSRTEIPPAISLSGKTEFEWWEVNPWRPASLLGPAKPLWWVPVSLHRAVKEVDIDLFFGPNFVQPPLLNQPSIVIVHDMIHKVHPETHTLSYRLYLQTFLTASLSAADHVITVSENTKQDLLRYYDVAETSVSVAHGAASPRYRDRSLNESEQKRLRRKYGLPDKFLLYVGNIEPRKNLTTLVKSLERFPVDERPALVVVGQRHLADEGLEQALATSPVRDSIHFTGYVDERDLPFLYNLAHAFVYVSKYEGFGLPVVEALQSGVPVITSTAGSLPEVVGDAGLTVPPTNEAMLTNAIKTMWNDYEKHDEFQSRALNRAERFSWKSTSEQVAAVLEEVS